jgi:hypothetical protein
VYWWGDAQQPDKVQLSGLNEDDGSGHLLVHVEGSYADGSAFYEAADKAFTLVADGRPNVNVYAERGFWIDNFKDVFEFYLRIPQEEMAKLAEGGASKIRPRNESNEAKWKVAPGVMLQPAGDRHVEQDEPAQQAALRDHDRLTIARVYWSKSAEAPEFIRDSELAGPSLFLGHVAEWFPEERDGDQIKRFTEQAGARFVLKADEHPDVGVEVIPGSISSSDGALREVLLRIVEQDLLAPGTMYTLHALNGREGYTWAVAEGVTLVGGNVE